MISLVYAKRCHAMQLAAEIALETGNPVNVSSSVATTYVVSHIPLNQAAKDAITALVLAHVPSTTDVEEVVSLP